MSIPNSVTTEFIKEAISTGKEKWIMERQNFNPNFFNLYKDTFEGDMFMLEAVSIECKTEEQVLERFNKAFSFLEKFKTI
jgi:hypothetical protein